MDPDGALQLLGTWSRWKLGMFVIGSTFIGFPAGWQMMSIVFTGMDPEYRCRLPEGHEVSMAIPNVTSDGVTSLDRCHVWAEFSAASNRTVTCPDGWLYDVSHPYTISTEWDLVCDRQYMVDLSQTILVVGVMLGALVMSVLSDNIGRKKVFVFSVVCMSLVGVITAFVQDYITFAVCKFVTGILQQGVVLAGFVYVVELFPASQRTLMGMACQCFWAASMWVLALSAWLLPNWRHVTLCISLPGLCGIVMVWVCPESLPWLCIKNKTAQAKLVLKTAARVSKVTLPAEYQLTEADEAVLAQERARGVRGQLRDCLTDCCRRETVVSKGNYSFMDIVRSRKLLSFAIINTYLWCSNTLIYYGLSLSTGSLAGNPYLNFFLSGCVEIPAYILCAYALKYIGRRWSIFGFHLVAGIPLFVTIFIPRVTADGTDLSVPIVTLSMIGKFGITGSFASIFLYTAELFPTTVRSIGLGIASVGGRLGNFIAPFANTVAMQVWWLPNVVFGVMAIGAALLTLILPETLNRTLPETIEEVEAWSRTLSKEEKHRYKANQKSMQEMTDMKQNGKEDAGLKEPLNTKMDVDA